MHPSIRQFDTLALSAALDARRKELGLSWQQVADQFWNLSSELNRQRHDHPISVSTLTNLAKKQRATCQHVLFMLRWLGRTPESFLEGAQGDEARFALPQAGADRRLRWDLKRLYAALDDKRRHEAKTWSELASALGCTPSQLTGLRTARFATNIDLAMRIVQWLDQPAAHFISPASW